MRPSPELTNQFAGYAVAALDELAERLFDLISGLPQEALDFVPEGTTNSIAMLVVHMAWAEAGWIARVTGRPIPEDLALRLRPGRQEAGNQRVQGELPSFTTSAADLVALCRRVRQEVTVPALTPLADVDAEVPDPQRPMTVRGVLMHLIWHWTYHSGQVGLLRRLWSARAENVQARYRWTFAERVGTPRP